MNSFAWLRVLCWCSGFISCLAAYQSPSGDATISSLRREKPFFKTPRVSFVSSGLGPAFGHPWQLMPPMRTSRHHPLYWKASGDEEELFLREKRKLLLKNHVGVASNDQSDEPSLEIEALTVPSIMKEESTTVVNAGSVPEIRNFVFHNLGFKNKAIAVTPLEKNKLINTFWNAVYNPLPYGAPRSIQTSDETEAIFRKQASGLPFARTATREKERERAELRLPIPDSEIPSPGHYRQPVNESLLQASFNPQIRPRLQTANGENTTGRTVNVEAFRILMEIIKSLRNMNDMYPATASSSLPNEELI